MFHNLGFLQQGKYVEITFTVGGAPNGGQVTNFLLEKSRVAHQNVNERSFHVFYQLLKQKNQSLVERLGLASPDYFDYLRGSGCYDVHGVDDVAEFNETVKGELICVSNFGNREK